LPPGGPGGIALDDNELTTLPSMSAFGTMIYAISIKRNNITALVDSLFANTPIGWGNYQFILDISENAIAHVPSGFFNANTSIL
jgi:hypothetical protein